MGSFIRRRRPRANELGLEFTRGEGGVQAALFTPCGNGNPLRLEGMRPEWAISAARDLANELGLDVAVIDEVGIWEDDAAWDMSAAEEDASSAGGRRGTAGGCRHRSPVHSPVAVQSDQITLDKV